MLDRTIAPPAQPIRQVHLIEAQTQYLANGVPVHVIRAGKQPVVGIELLFKTAGTRQETKPGSCFFTVKMLAEGTASKSAYEISASVDQYGAFLQLSPGIDYSTVDLYCLSKHTNQLLPLLQEMITEPSFLEDELDKLKNIQQQKLKVNNEKSSVLASKKMKAVLFGETHPYGRSLQEETIEAIHPEDLRSFHQHGLSNLEIIASGDVSEEVLQALEKHFGKLHTTNADKPEVMAAFSPAGDKRLVVEKPDSLQSSIRMGLPLFTKDHPDYAAMRIVNTLLGGYFGSRLMRNIREEKGLTYGINSGMVLNQGAGYFIIGTDVKKAFTGVVIDEIYKEIQRLREEKVDEAELNTVKSYMAGRLLSSVDTPFALAEKFKNIYLYGLGYDFYKNYLHTINTIQAGTIQQMAEKHLIPGQIREVIVGGFS